jgi:membrane protease YdiL (CAAX protease family)
MTAPFPSGLTARTARWQAAALLAFFYSLVYGGGIFLGGMHHRMAAPIVSAIILGTLLLLATVFFVRRDASWRQSLGLGRQPVGAMLGWSLLGFVGTYAVNVVLSGMYLTIHGDLQTVVAGRTTWLVNLAELPVGTILPLAAFVAVWEETVFRGFLLGRLRASMPVQDTRGRARRRDVLAVVLTAIFFGAGHGYQGMLGLIQTTAAGAVLGVLSIWRKSLWPAIGAHLAIDTFGFLLLKALKPMLRTLTYLTVLL